MKTIVEMMFLGMQEKESKKSGKRYFMAKFMNLSSKEIFEFYVSGEQLTLITNMAKLEIASMVKVGLKISSYQGKAQVDLEGVKAE